MAYLTFVLSAVSLLLASSNAAPKGTNNGITVPEECKGKGFCNIRPAGYDDIEKKINEILPPHMIDSRSGEPTEPTEKINDDDDNCPSKTTWESVYAYDNPKNPTTKLDIIVQTKFFPQMVAKVTCAHNEIENRRFKEGGPQCFRNLGLSNFNMKFSCQESTATRTLLVYDPEVHLLKMKNYTIPVCCSCQITTL